MIRAQWQTRDPETHMTAPNAHCERSGHPQFSNPTVPWQWLVKSAIPATDRFVQIGRQLTQPPDLLMSPPPYPFRA
jgi:hypothetical protein